VSRALMATWSSSRARDAPTQRCAP
jgi:hypothetical protein